MLYNYKIDSQQSYTEWKEYVSEEKLTVDNWEKDGEGIGVQLTDGSNYFLNNQSEKVQQFLKQNSLKYNPLIFGKDQTERIVSIEGGDGYVTIYKEMKDGSIETEVKKHYPWIIGTTKAARGGQLKGNLPYKYIKEYHSLEEFNKAKAICYRRRVKFFTIADPRESCMVMNGYTYFKGMEVEDVSVLSFDAETTRLNPDASDAQVLLISNTFRKQDKITKKLFAIDDYGDDEGAMIQDWCKWVREMNPSIMIGHNIYSFDFPYLNTRYQHTYGSSLELGRDDSIIKFNKRSSKVRKDGSQSYDYHKCFIHGREIIDTFFLALKYDFKRVYPSYGLKAIIDYEKLTKEGRVFYDASKIRENWHIREERKKIKEYCIDDSDDSLALYDLMIPSYFYLAQSIPKPFQTINESATGSQINAFMVRSYLQNWHSLPIASDRAEYEGAISAGNPGVYKNVRKVDVASLYPSIILQYKISDKKKDPHNNFIKTVEYFTKERLENKRLGKETKNKYYKDMEQAQKIFINSCYGFLGSSGLVFNYPEGASEITRKGREILQEAIDWAEAKGYVVPNCDTDSISYCNENGEYIPDQTFLDELDELNNLSEDKISWEDDGNYPGLLVLKAKNYVLNDGKKLTYKGSGIKDQKKEPALMEFMYKVIDKLFENKVNEIEKVYHDYIIEANNVDDINRWAAKKTVTAKVLNPERTNEAKVLEAIGEKPVQEGDKIWVYFDEDKRLKLVENWNEDENKIHLTERVYKTLVIFKEVVDMANYVKYQNKRSAPLLNELLNEA